MQNIISIVLTFCTINVMLYAELLEWRVYFETFWLLVFRERDASCGACKYSGRHFRTARAWKHLKGSYPDVFTRLESIAKVQSVKGSNAIEGIVTSEQRINEIVNQNSAPINHNEAEIAGYRDVLNLIHENFTDLDIRVRDIHRLHEIMLSYTPIGGGSYKQNDNVITEVDAAGQRRVRFAPTPAGGETVTAMEQLILAFIDARNNYNINQLLMIPCFILDFLCIHPFADCNGRMSRLLSLLLLYKNGLDAGKYISFEEQINKKNGITTKPCVCPMTVGMKT